MNKKHTLIILSVLAVVGSFVNFYATNLVMDTISNIEHPQFILRFTPSLSGLFVAIEFILAFFFFMRLYLHQTHKKRMIFVYGITLAAMGGVGIILTIISATVLYGSFTIASPFAGYHIVVLIWHLLMVALGLVMALYLKNRVKDPDIILYKTKARYVIFTIFVSLLIFFTFNRFGAFLWAPFYIQWRTISSTYSFYLSLLLLIAMGVNIVCYVFNVYKGRIGAVTGVAVSSVIATLSLVFFIQIVTRGISDPLFVASISPAVPIERLATIPIDTVLQSLVVIILALYTITHSFAFKRFKDRDKDVPQSRIIIFGRAKKKKK